MTDSPRAAVESFELSLLQRVRDILEERSAPARHTLQRCLQELAHSCRADHVVLATLGHDAQVHLDLSIGLSPEQIQESSHRIEEGVLGRVIKTGEPVATEPQHRERDGATHGWPFAGEEVRRYLCVPVQSRALGVIGALGVDRCRPEAPWMRDELRLFTVIAALLAPQIATLRHHRAREDASVRESAAWMHADPAPSAPAIVGESAQVRHLLRWIARVAPTDSTALIRGERGVGKALTAAEIHAQSHRRDRPLVSVNCAALTGAMAESELFGHAKGALASGGARRGFFGQAEGGTLLLDEVSELPLSLQAKLLHLLRERAIGHVGNDGPQLVDVRVLASTNVDLVSAVRARSFREDLYDQLCTTQIAIPPLRARKSDIASLVRHFCSVFSVTHRCPLRPLSAATMAALMAHDWPGNVRELQNVIQRALLGASGPRIEVDDLPIGVRPDDFSTQATHDTLEQRISDFERETILDAMREAGGSHAKAARALQTTPRILSYRLRRLGAAAAE